MLGTDEPLCCICQDNVGVPANQTYAACVCKSTFLCEACTVTLIDTHHRQCPVCRLPPTSELPTALPTVAAPGHAEERDVVVFIPHFEVVAMGSVAPEPPVCDCGTFAAVALMMWSLFSLVAVIVWETIWEAPTRWRWDQPHLWAMTIVVYFGISGAWYTWYQPRVRFMLLFRDVAAVVMLQIVTFGGMQQAVRHDPMNVLLRMLLATPACVDAFLVVFAGVVCCVAARSGN